MELFYKDLYQGEVDLHDSWQIELESAFSPLATDKKSTYIQEFYFFIPSSLQISHETYSKENFYSDRTNFVRKKTPEIPLEDLIRHDVFSPSSPPLLQELLAHSISSDIEAARNAVLILSNVFRTALRKKTREYIDRFSFLCPYHFGELHEQERKHLNTEHLLHAFSDSESAAKALVDLQRTLHAFVVRWRTEIIHHVSRCFAQDSRMKETLRACDVYMSFSIDFYISGLLAHIHSFIEQNHQFAQPLVQLLSSEKSYRHANYDEPLSLCSLSELEKEHILYMRSTNEKFVRSVLVLELKKRSFSKRWGHIIASFAAGCAAFLYLFLLLWNSTVGTINSMSLVIISSVLYMLKDRIKEVIKNIFQQEACRLFDDFRIDLYAGKNAPFGWVKEFFTFLFSSSVPDDISRLRSLSSKPHLCMPIGDAETVLYYRKRLVFPRIGQKNSSFVVSAVPSLHTIFRLNLRALLDKASDPEEDLVAYDTAHALPVRMHLPKVYHLNLIVKTISTSPAALKKTVVYHKYRIVADKSTIKRVERVYEGDLSEESEQKQPARK